jgi:hypothetical protein
MMGSVALKSSAGFWGLTARIRLARLRPGLAVVAVVLILGMLLPAESYARRYAFAETLQFVIFAVAAPVLLVLGGPWRIPGLTRDQDRLPGPARRLTLSRWPGVSRPAAVLLAFIAVVVAWRLPVTVNALPGHPALTVAEAVTLLAAGAGVWRELARPPLLSGLSRPQRAAMAAGAMWTIWVLAYVMGMSHGAWFAAYRHAGHGLSTAADQQFAVAIMWVVPATARTGTRICARSPAKSPPALASTAGHGRPRAGAGRTRTAARASGPQPARPVPLGVPAQRSGIARTARTTVWRLEGVTDMRPPGGSILVGGPGGRRPGTLAPGVASGRYLAAGCRAADLAGQ